ncbi:MAG: hypothetical protein ACE5HT_14565 [Gemmatimonadales bacterium]
MTDEQFEEFLRDAVRDHNPAPETPREEIWARIQEVRSLRSNVPEVVWFRSPWLRRGLGIAAVLILGIGIGMSIGRVSSDTPVVASIAVAESVAVSDVYRVVTANYLSDAEAFLTMFRTDARAGRVALGDGNPARQLLTTTRLLQGSPAARDPRMNELLNDLEFVLMQIAQLRAGEDGTELDLATQGMEERSVLLKIHAALPSDPQIMNVRGVL